MIIFIRAHKSLSPDIQQQLSLYLGDNNYQISDLGDFIMIHKKGDLVEINHEERHNLLILIEGSVLLTPNKAEEKLCDLYLRYGVNMGHFLHGFFNLIIIDRSKGKLLAINDCLGTYPLYYSQISDGSCIISSDFSAIRSFAGAAFVIDEIALREYACFNYVLGSRTLLKNISRLTPGSYLDWDRHGFKIIRYWDIRRFYKNSIKDEHEFYILLRDVFIAVVRKWVGKHVNIGLLLSGGYDSRLLLACLSHVGISVRAYTWKNQQVDDVGIAATLAGKVPCAHRVVDNNIPDSEIDNVVAEAMINSGFTMPIFHIDRYYAIKQIKEQVDMLFSGQGELIRYTPVPNDYITSDAIRFLKGKDKEDPAKTRHFFNLPDGGSYAGCRQDFFPWSSNLVEDLTTFLFFNAYRDDYGTLRNTESRLVPVIMPFLDRLVVEVLLQGPFALCRQKNWAENPLATFRTRRLYLELINHTAPTLLEVKLDRGYPAIWDSNSRGFLMLILYGFLQKMKSRLRKRQTTPDQWRKYVYRLLSDDRMRQREHINQSKLFEILKRWPLWTPVESYELEKIARFELFMRGYA